MSPTLILVIAPTGSPAGVIARRDAHGPTIPIWQGYASDQQEVRKPTLIPVILRGCEFLRHATAGVVLMKRKIPRCARDDNNGVIPSAAKDLTDRSDAGRVAGVRSSLKRGGQCEP